CFRNIVVTRLRTLGPPSRAGGAPKVSGLRSAVSLTSLIPILPFARGLCSGSYPGPRRFTVARRHREPPRACYFQRATTGQTEIGPVCLMYFCSFVEPSYRLGVAVYASTLPLTTNFRPVSVVGGDTRPPESWKR